MTARDMIIVDSATKPDLEALKLEIDGSLWELELRVTVKIGAICVAAVAVVSAVQKLF